MVSVVLIAFVMRDPPRGHSEGSQLASTSWRKDIVYLLKKYAYLFITYDFHYNVNHFFNFLVRL